VEKLAVDSATHLAGRARAEAALESTSEELQRAARFSADASHQLKTPVTVLRAGLEELLARDHLSVAERESLSALVHQTYRLSGVIEDLLLLSRLDAGRLRLDLAPVDLAALIAASVDDLSALPDDSELAVETDLPPALLVSAERRYAALILQNLLENARKYNRSGGRIRIAARVAADLEHPAEVDAARVKTAYEASRKAQLAPACRDQGLVVFDPINWQMERGRLGVTARKGHKAWFDRQSDGTWLRDPKEGKTLILRPI
jgi:signal transduction histidine kinase